MTQNIMPQQDNAPDLSQSTTGNRRSLRGVIKPLWVTIMNDKKIIVMEEFEWQKLVAEQTKGIIEVKTPVGNIDVLSNSAIYEIKQVNKWKHALGQVISYGYFYPEKEKIIYLYGDTNDSTKQLIKTICQQYNVVVKFTSDFLKIFTDGSSLMREHAEYESKQKHRMKYQEFIENQIKKLLA